MTFGYARTNCCITGCRRGTTTIEPLPRDCISMDTGKGRHEWICSVHWRLIPKSWKRRRRRFHRRVAKTWPWKDGIDWDELTDDQRREHSVAFRLSKKMWARMKAHAESPLSSLVEEASLEDVERAFGIAV